MPCRINGDNVPLSQSSVCVLGQPAAMTPAVSHKAVLRLPDLVSSSHAHRIAIGAGRCGARLCSRYLESSLRTSWVGLRASRPSTRLSRIIQGSTARRSWCIRLRIRSDDSRLRTTGGRSHVASDRRHDCPCGGVCMRALSALRPRSPALITAPRPPARIPASAMDSIPSAAHDVRPR